MMERRPLKLKVISGEKGAILELERLELSFVENYCITKNSEMGDYAVVELKMLIDPIILDSVHEPNA